MIKIQLENSTLQSYNRYIKQKAEAVKNQIKKFNTFQPISVINSNRGVAFTEDEIATAAMAKLNNISGYEKSILALQEQLNSKYKQLGQAIELPALGELAAIQSGLLDGKEYSMSAQNLQTLAEAAVKFNTKSQIYNTVGDLGEIIAELQGTAIANSIIEKFKEANPNTNIMGTKIVGEQLGVLGSGRTKSLTDTNFKVYINFLNNQDGVPRQIEFSFNLSDKLSLAKKTKTIYYQRSTIATQTPNEDKKYIYNILSYHKNKDNRIYNFYFDNDSEIKAYFSYKLLFEFLQRARAEGVNFSIFNGQITPMNKLLQEKLTLDNAVKYFYLQASKKELKDLMFQTQTLEEYIAKRPIALRETI